MIAIRNMEKPSSCGLCQLCLNDSRIANGYCMFFHRTVNMMELDKACPLIEIDDELIKKLQESAIIIKAVHNRLKKMVNDSDELKTELMGTNTNLVMFDEPNTGQRNVELYSGCRDCSYELKCPDAFTDVAPLCNGYKGAVK